MVNKMVVSKIEFEGMAYTKTELIEMLCNFKEGHPEGWRVCKLELIPVWGAVVVLSSIEKVPEGE